MVPIPIYGPMHEQSCNIHELENSSNVAFEIEFERGGSAISFCIANDNLTRPAVLAYRVSVKYGICKFLTDDFEREYKEGEYHDWFPLSKERKLNLIQFQSLLKDTKITVHYLQATSINPTPDQTTFHKTDTAFANADFEEGNLNSWTPEGNAFDNQPTFEDNAGYRLKTMGAFPAGDYWIGTFEDRPGGFSPPRHVQGDEPTGTLLSDPFPVSKRFLSGLLGGGNHKDTAVSILIDGTEIARFTGVAHESMKPFLLDLTGHRNRKCRIKIIDNNQENWGHVNTDNFLLFGEFEETENQ